MTRKLARSRTHKMIGGVCGRFRLGSVARTFCLRPGEYSQRGLPRNSHLPPSLGADAEAGATTGSLISRRQAILGRTEIIADSLAVGS